MLSSMFNKSINCWELLFLKIKDLLNQFELFLKISDEVLDLEVEGEYISYTTEKDDELGHVYYVFEDSNHRVELSETNGRCMLVYSTFVDRDAPAHVKCYDNLGGIVSIT